MPEESSSASPAGNTGAAGNPTPGQVTMDSAGMRKFIDGPLADFIEDLKRIRRNDPGQGPSLSDLIVGRSNGNDLAQDKILSIGLMNSDSFSSGQQLHSRIAEDATTLDGTLAEQNNVFGEINHGMESTVETLEGTQNDNLSSITGEQMSDMFSDVSIGSGVGGVGLGGTGGIGGSGSVGGGSSGNSATQDD
ncbi:type VII secretion system-associated protein [Streptomyces sp. NPDC026673]|uniref:type VII secretion system-associated protein n=1 Tax=Streptomyces sp. NPDC026673 TaxID=3155724 RepID=UPI0033E9AD50